MGAVRTVKVILEGQATGLLATFATTRAAASGLGKEFETLAVKNKSGMNAFNKLSLGVGGALVVGFGLAVRAGMEFDKQMSAVGAVADASAAQMDGLRAAALQAGRDTAFTATQAAQAEEELAKAGISTSDILSGGLKGALSLAAAGNINLGDAAKFASQAMIEFGLHGKDVAHIADVLTAGANKSVTDIQGLGDALGQTGTVAHQAGMSLDETVGVMALFAQHGLDGVEAGTTFKTMLLKLEAPTAKSADLMESLGLNVYDASGKFLSAAGLAAALQKSLGGLTEAQRNAALGTIFGTRAVRGAIDLYNAGAAGVNQWTAAVNDTGIAARTAQTKLNNLSGDVKKLQGSLQTFAIEASGGANMGLRILTQGATGLVNAFTSLPPVVTSTATVLAGVSGASLLAAVGLLKIKTTINEVSTALKGMGPNGARAVGFISGLGKYAGPLGLVAIGLAGVATYVDKILVHGDDFRPVARDVDKLTASLIQLANSGKVTGYLAQTMGADLQKLGTELQALKLPNLVDTGGASIAIANINEQLDKLRAQGTKDISAMNDALVGLVKSGSLSTANLAFQDVTRSLLAQGMSIAQVSQAFGGYLTAAGQAAAGSTGAAAGFASADQKAGLLASSMATLISRGEDFETVWNELNGALLDSDQASLAANQAIEKVTSSLKKNKDAWKGNSDGALEDRVAVGEAAKAASKAAKAKYDETGSVSAANKVYDSYIGQLRKSLLAAGLSKGAVDALLKSYGKMPPSVTTHVSAPGLNAAKSAAATYLGILNRIPGSKTTDINTHYTTSGTGPRQASRWGGAYERWGGAYEKAAAGTLREASYYTATNPGRYMIAEPATHGEYFVPKTGNYGRSMAILNRAAANYGARVTAGGGGGGSVGIQVMVSAAPGFQQAFLQFLRFTIKDGGGDVVRVLTPK